MTDRPENQHDATASDQEQGHVPVENEVAPITPGEPIRSTRTSRALIRLLPALVVLTVILVFVFQNPKDVKVSLFTFSGTLPLSVALLGAVILGALMALALGSIRIFQLRKQVRRKKRENEGDRRRHR
jgi:uncharacterized integral membrane protein